MNTAIKTDYQSLLGLGYAPSIYQQRVFDAVAHGTGHVVVDACAGSGKTTTSVSACELARGDVLSVAFNRDIARVLGERITDPRVVVRTAHKHGLATVAFWCWARMGLNGQCTVEVDEHETKYRAMFEAASEIVTARCEAFEDAIARETAGEPEATRAAMDALVRESLADMRPTLCGEVLSDDAIAEVKAFGFPVGECVQLCTLARLFLLDFDADSFDSALDAIAVRYDVDVSASLWGVVVEAVRNALCRGCTPPESGAWLVDFTDMVWLPFVCGMRPKQYDWVFVDECQDISPAARKLMMASVKRGGRTCWVGDPCQAINGFAGADSESFSAIIRETSARVLPLSVCYRCPTSHLAIARQWKPGIQARDGAPVGTIRTLERSDYVEDALRGDLVICRRNAPLIQLCFELIASGVSATVRGRADMAKGIVKLATRASKTKAPGSFADRLDAFEAKESAKLRTRARTAYDAEQAIEALGDRVECVRVIQRSSGAETVDALTAAIAKIFSSDEADVTLSSVHRAKGLEADRVVILEHDRLMSTRARQQWQIEQEEHLAYVAYTRAKHDLVLIPAPKREK